MGNIRGESAKRNREKNEEKKKNKLKKLALGDIKKIENVSKPLSKKIPNLKKWNESLRKDDFKGSRSRFDNKADKAELADVKDTTKKKNNKKDNNKRKLALGDLPKKSKAQLMAIKRNKEGLKISDVVAANEKAMREKARKRHEEWKKRNKK